MVVAELLVAGTVTHRRANGAWKMWINAARKYKVS